MRFIKLSKSENTISAELYSAGFSPIMQERDYLVYEMSDRLLTFVLGKFEKTKFIVTDKLLF